MGDAQIAKEAVQGFSYHCFNHLNRYCVSGRRDKQECLFQLPTATCASSTEATSSAEAATATAKTASAPAAVGASPTASASRIAKQAPKKKRLQTTAATPASR